MSRSNFRENILAAGLEALQSRGFNATSVQDITEAAGVPKGSFYNHFSSKEELGAAVVEQYALQAGKRAAVFADAGIAPLERIRRYFEHMVELVGQPGTPGCLLGNFGLELSNQSPAIRARVAIAFEDWTLALAAVIAEAQDRGDMKKEIDAKTIADFVIDSWEGAVLRSKVEQDCAPLKTFLTVTFSKILA